jgi:DNA-binding response OmpR family regulator
MDSQLSIVLVEDHDALRELTTEALQELGHRVTALTCAEDLEDVSRATPTDLFILDLNLPGEDGISLSKRIRNSYPKVGIIILTARSTSKDKVIGYESGADLYITKPVDREELIAAIKSLTRRKVELSMDNTSGPLCVSEANLELTGPQSKAKVSAAEAALLTAFSRAPSGRLEIWQLAEILNLDLSEISKSSLEVRIVRLRKKMIEVGCQVRAIESVRGFGYQCLVPIKIL